jgi:hypothetical protein
VDNTQGSDSADGHNKGSSSQKRNDDSFSRHHLKDKIDKAMADAQSSLDSIGSWKTEAEAAEAFRVEVAEFSKKYNVEIGATIYQNGIDNFTLSDLYTDYLSGQVKPRPITELAVGLIHTHGRPSMKSLEFSGHDGDIGVYLEKSELVGRPITGWLALPKELHKFDTADYINSIYKGHWKLHCHNITNPDNGC